MVFLSSYKQMLEKYFKIAKTSSFPNRSQLFIHNRIRRMEYEEYMGNAEIKTQLQSKSLKGTVH
jgi:hypothetical protein